MKTLVREGIYKKGMQYLAVVFVYGTDGRRKRLTKTFPILSEAEAWRRKKLCEKDDGKKAIPQNITVLELAMEALAARKSKNKSTKEVERYIHEPETGILDFFGRRTPITRINDAAIRAWIEALKTRDKLARDRTVMKGHNLSPRSIDHRLILMRSMIRMAVKKGWLHREPEINLVGRGRGEQRDLPINLAQFIKAAEGLEATRKAMCWMAFYTGQRWGDIRKMKWDQIRNDRVFYRSTKTHKSGLSIPLPEDLKQMLDALPRSLNGFLEMREKAADWEAKLTPTDEGEELCKN